MSIHPGPEAPLLRAAYAPPAPGPVLPPGPRRNPWERVGAAPAALPHAPALALRALDVLLRPRGAHRLPDGAASSIQRRAVPSAGGSYGVRAHVLERVGRGEVRVWAHDPDARKLLLRAPAGEGLVAGMPARHDARVLRSVGLVEDSPREPDAAGPGPSAACSLVFSVRPGRASSRYRHRAWPLWLADAAYAAAGAELLLGTRAERIADVGAARVTLGWPPARHAQAWLDRGLVPELPLARVPIPPHPAPGMVAAACAIGGRRSPSPEAFLANAAAPHTVDPHPVDPAAAGLARASGQAWIAGAGRVLTWSVDPAALSPQDLLAAAWDAPLAAARSLYAEQLEGSWASRPVSGLVESSGRWIIHALASLPTSDAPGGGLS